MCLGVYGAPKLARAPVQYSYPRNRLRVMQPTAYQLAEPYLNPPIESPPDSERHTGKCGPLPT